MPARITCAVVVVALLSACSGNTMLSRLTRAPSPHERYGEALRQAELRDTALARDWLAAADSALAQPLSVATPMRETGYVSASQPGAVAYRLDLERGRRLAVDVTFDAVAPARLFVDVFEVRPGAAPQRVASLTDGHTLSMEVPRDGSYLLRIQAELLRSGRFTVVQRTLASLPFPVEGLTARAVQSEFGATRDAGRRAHEGIDIFAARHTPALAVVDGVASSGTNPLGGNVVWLRDRGAARSFYYAHLTRAAFEGTAVVRAGDVVGYIGNSGNAGTTAPHLHFGIYERGAIDPLPFLRADDPLPAAPMGEEWLSAWVRVRNARAVLQHGTAQSAAAAAQLERGTLARVVGATGTRLRVELPDGSGGYLDRASVALADVPLRRQTLRTGQVVRERPRPDAPVIRTIEEPVPVEVLGEFDGFAFVRAASLPPGWIGSDAGNP